jgi:hypothetical protein
MGFGGIDKAFVLSKAAVVVVTEDRVSVSFDGCVVHHYVATYNDTDLLFLGVSHSFRIAS